MVARIISRADFARECGRSKPAVTKACRGSLAPACVGDRINADHPAAQAYRAASEAAGAVPAEVPTEHKKPGPKARFLTDQAPTAKRQPAPNARSGRTLPRPAETVPPHPTVAAPSSNAELEEMQALLKPLTDRFGTSRYFADWLQSLRTIEIILEKHLNNEEAQGRLISRELVKAHVFGLLNAMSRNLLQDAPKTIARRLAGHFNAKGTVEDAERIVRDNLSAQIEPVKLKAARVLRETD